MTLVLRHNVAGREVAPPLSLDRHRRRLSSVVARHADRTRPFIVSVHRRNGWLRPDDETVRLRKAWKNTLVGPNDAVVITYLPRGGSGQSGSSAKQIGGLVAMIALAVAAPWLVGTLGIASLGTVGSLTIAGKIVAAGIVLGGAYLISQATKPNANKTDDRPIYGVAGGGNLPRPGDRIPACYGHFWTQPDLTQPDYTTYDGEDQLLYKRMTLGLGKYQVHKIMIGAATFWVEDEGIKDPFTVTGEGGGTGGGGGGSTVAPITGGSGVGAEVEFIEPGGTSTLVPDVVYSSPSVGGAELPRAADNPAFAGPFAVCPVGEQVSRIQIDFSVPQVSSNNGLDPGNWSVVFQYAPCDEDDNPTAAFTQFIAEGETKKSTRPQRFTRFVDLTLGRYVVRGQNTQPEVEGNVNSVTWDGLRGHFNSEITRSNVTEIAIRVRSGKALGVTDFRDVWIEATRILPVWNGTAWVDTATRKSVWAYSDILRASYGGNIPDSQIDVATLKAYADSETQFDTFDGVIRGPVSVFEASGVVLGTMRSDPTRISQAWSMRRDEPSAVKKHVITRRQIARGTTLMDAKIARDDGAAHVIVEYSPDGDPRRRREASNVFGTPSLTPHRVQVTGVSDWAHAKHLAIWLSAAAFYRRERRKVTVDRRGRLISRGDPARIDAWFMSDARAAGVMASSGNTLTLDTDVVVDNGIYATLRDKQGREWGPVAVTAGAAENIIVLDSDDVATIEDFTGLTLAEVLAGDAQEMTSVLVGPITELDDPYIIDSVTPQGRDRVNVEALYDHPSVWDALGEVIPVEPTIPGVGGDDPDAVPTIPWVQARAVQDALTLVMHWSIGRARGAAVNVVDLSYDEGDTWELVSKGQDLAGSYPLRHVDGAALTVRAYAINALGVAGPSVFTTLTTFMPVVNDLTALIEVKLKEFNDALEDQVTDMLSQFNSVRSGVEQMIAAFGADMIAQRVLDTMKAKKLLGEHAEQITTVEQTAEDAAASVETVQTAFADFEIAFAEYQVNVTSQFGAVTATANTALTTATTANTALATYKTEVTAALGAPLSSFTGTARVFQKFQAIGDLNSGLIGTVNETAEVASGQADAAFAQASLNLTAIGTINGKMAATFSLTTNVSGKISGIRGFNTGSTSLVDIEADAFRIGKSTGAGSTTFAPVFQVSTVDGSAKVAMRGDLLADGTITARLLTVGVIDSIHVKAFAIDTEHLAIAGVSIDNLIKGSAGYLSGAVVGGTTLTQGVERTLGTVAFTVAADNFGVILDTSIRLGGAVSGPTSVTLRVYTRRVSPTVTSFSLQDDVDADTTYLGGTSYRMVSQQMLRIFRSNFSAGTYEMQVRALFAGVGGTTTTSVGSTIMIAQDVRR